MFGHPRYVIKAGEIVIEEGEIRNVVERRSFLVQPSCDPAIEQYLRPVFEDYYTMSFANYPVELTRLERPQIFGCKRVV